MDNKRKAKPVGLGAKRSKGAEVPGVPGVPEATKQSREDQREDQREETSTNNKGLYIELPEDATQLDELKSLLELAESVADDPEKAIPLLRGVIHECDAIVRQQDNEEQGDAQVPLDAPFWTVYGDAMSLLGQVEFREDAPLVIEFVQQAMDCYDKALQSTDGDNKMAMVKRAVTSCLLFALKNEDDEEEEEVSFDDKYVKEALECKLELPHLKALYSGLLEAASEADNCERVIALLQPLLQSEVPDGDAELSLIRLRLATFYAESKLEHIVDSQADDAADSTSDEELLRLSDLLVLRLEECRDDSKEGLLVRGESVMLRSAALELLSEPTHDQAALTRSLEQSAVALFKKAEEAGVALPESIHDFVYGQ